MEWTNPHRAIAAALALAATIATADDGGRPDDAGGDLSIAHMARQPAGMVMCSYGYFAAKSGDYHTANAIFDRCIEAGYAGSMIWKALMYEEGNGVPQDSARATQLLYRAATSGDPAYATLGKLHYATALHQGKGVARDETEALKWFRAAAAEGDPDAREFLRSGRHVGVRDGSGHGVGASAPQVQGLRLERQETATPPDPARSLPGLLLVALGALFAGGWLRQARGLATGGAR